MDEISWFYYRCKGSGWLVINGKTFKVANMDEAMDLLDAFIKGLRKTLE
jgi:hypothetical protein